MRHSNYNMANNSTTNNTLYMSSQHIDSSLPNENGDTDQAPLTLEKIKVKVVGLLEIIILNFFSISNRYRQIILIVRRNNGYYTHLFEKLFIYVIDYDSMAKFSFFNTLAFH